MKIEGKVFVVTGAGNGMGREIALLLLEKGACVAAVDLNESALKETVARAGEASHRLSTHVLNITDREAVFALPDAVIQGHGAVDAIINNAGIVQPFVKINDLELADIERVFKVNLWGVVYMTKAFLPHLLKRPEAYIANVSSMGGFLPVPGQTAYGASKAAVSLFTDGLHSELMNTNVHVSTIFPGAIETNITANSGVKIELGDVSKDRSRMKMTTARDAARMIVDGIEKNRYHILVGQDARMMDTIRRLSPERAARFIYSQMRSLLPE